MIQLRLFFDVKEPAQFLVNYSGNLFVFHNGVETVIRYASLAKYDSAHPTHAKWDHIRHKSIIPTSLMLPSCILNKALLVATQCNALENADFETHSVTVNPETTSSWIIKFQKVSPQNCLARSVSGATSPAVSTQVALDSSAQHLSLFDDGY